uniref:Glucose dehydrogenase [FAD, quinone]-like n=1 Tax=Diabrotica virgifera virgifera TaxID=50390 RepID=A0A6P7GLX7_DIAVI
MKLKTILLISCYVTVTHTQITETIKHYEDIIEKGIKDSANHKAPKDASIYKARKKPIKTFGSYDFIVIGGGVTGSVIASRLSERKDFKVLVIEAGNFTDNGIIQFPGLFQYSLSSSYNWAYKSIPQTTACLGAENKVCDIPRGRGIGGTSLINGLVSSRGHPDDYNTWAKILNDNSWNYSKVLPYFKNSENFHWTNKKAPVDPKYHGTKGLLNVQHKVPNVIYNDIFLDANKELGSDIIDYNSNRQQGASIFQLFNNNGKRQDLGSAFIIPFLNRTNLKVLTQSYVIKIEISKRTKTVKGVLFTKGGYTYRAKAKKEVILCAGAIASPQILMLSGIGPKKHLKDIKIPLIKNLEVGTRLRDHLDIKLLFSGHIIIPKQNITQQLQDYLKGSGTLTALSYTQGVAFHETKNRTRKGVPNLEIIMDVEHKPSPAKSVSLSEHSMNEVLWSNNTLGLSFTAIHTDPKSTGTLRLKSRNPFDYPLINPNLLSDSENNDIDELYQSIQLIFKLSDTKAFQRIKLKYMSKPLPVCSHLKFKSKDYWYCFLRQMTTTALHPMSTCPMGRSPKQGAVVDSNLKVFGIKRLRVADASVFPISTTGHPCVPCIMIGEKISDYIKYHY